MRRILVAVDASPRAPLVVDAAARLAQLAGAKLIVYRAIGLPPELPVEVYALQGGQLEEVLQAKARGELDALLQAVEPALIERVVTAFATAWDGVCRAAREHEADLVVIGSHGYGGLDRVLGTTAARVVNHCDRNVLVVRATL